MEKLKVIKVLSEMGNRVYEFKNSKIPSSGWASIDLAEFVEQRRFFMDVKDERVVALIHHCPQLPANARYVWQGRLFKPPSLPLACPRCRYRIDYKPKHG